MGAYERFPGTAAALLCLPLGLAYRHGSYAEAPQRSTILICENRTPNPFGPKQFAAIAHPYAPHDGRMLLV